MSAVAVPAWLEEAWRRPVLGPAVRSLVALAGLVAFVEIAFGRQPVHRRFKVR